MPARTLSASVAVLALLAPACGAGPDPALPPQRAGTVVVNGEVANDHGTEQVGPDGELVIEAGDFFFGPTVLLGPAGLERQALVRGVGGERHTITVPELAIDVEVEPGAAVEVEVAFPESGTTLFFCRFHRERGMLGALVTA